MKLLLLISLLCCVAAKSKIELSCPAITDENDDITRHVLLSGFSSGKPFFYGPVSPKCSSGYETVCRETTLRTSEAEIQSSMSAICAGPYRIIKSLSIYETDGRPTNILATCCSLHPIFFQEPSYKVYSNASGNTDLYCGDGGTAMTKVKLITEGNSTSAVATCVKLCLFCR